MTPPADSRRAVNAHYGQPGLAVAILAALRAAGLDADALTPDALAPLDHFHTGGLAATLALRRLAALSPGSRVLDVGGGIGGPARTLAREADCHVTVLDLTEAFCRVGAMLTARTGLTGRVTFGHGSALDLPFADGSFDAVWMQNAGMNIADKGRLFAEVARVLRPGGRVALQEVTAGPVQPPHYPVPWARDASLSYLLPAADLRALLAAAGFREVAWQEAAPAPPAPGAGGLVPLLAVLWGEAAWQQMSANARRNEVEGRTRLIWAVAERP